MSKLKHSSNGCGAGGRVFVSLAERGKYGIIATGVGQSRVIFVSREIRAGAVFRRQERPAQGLKLLRVSRCI
ncbi:MAG: hypothetical protein WA784_09195 [Albidovulum sp.]